MTPAFIWPTDSRVLSSGFTDRRSYGQHNAIDIVALQGEPVRAIADGIVYYAGWAGSAGLSIWIDHDSGWRSHYCHLSQLGVIAGIRVGSGVRIGDVGATGDATGPHLHLNLFSPTEPLSGPSAYVPWVGRWAVDPLHYLSDQPGAPSTEETMEKLVAGSPSGRVYLIGALGKRWLNPTEYAIRLNDLDQARPTVQIEDDRLAAIPDMPTR